MVVPWLSSSRPCSERLLMPTSRSRHFKRGRDSAGTAKKKIAPVDSGKTRRQPAAPGKYRRLSAPPGGLRRQPAAPAKLRGGGRKPAALTVTNGSRCKPTSRSKVAAQQADAQVNGRDLCFLCGSVDELDVEHAHRHATRADSGEQPGTRRKLATRHRLWHVFCMSTTRVFEVNLCTRGKSSRNYSQPRCPY